MIVGLTGSIGTGKSTVSEMFRDLGAPVIDYDQLARDVVEPGGAALGRIREAFGDVVLTPEGALDRGAMGDIVFRDPEARKKLNNIVHPEVFLEDQRRTRAILKENPNAVVIKEIPLLTQIGIDPHELVDKVVVVSASYENQIRRVMERGFTEQQAVERIAAQVPVSETEKLGDYVILNDGSFEETSRQVEKVYDELLAEAARGTAR
ncbi:MAG: dephospho-CoA kinase [Desulfatibacillaceae bacterium]